MLISCFQCRQQLDVPEDSAGKRVRCPHCHYVIVVPARAKSAPADQAETPVTALPSMELDSEGDKPATTKIPAQPLPPYQSPPTETGKSEPERKAHPPIEDMPEMPSIDRGRRRRVPMSPTPPSTVRWGRFLGIGGVVGLIAVGVIVGVFSGGNRRRPPQPQMVFHNPPMQAPMDPMPFQNLPHLQQRPFDLQQRPFALMDWRTVQKPAHRFKAQFPGESAESNQKINLAAMTVCEVKQFDWEFSVAHGTLTDRQFQTVPLHNRFQTVLANLCVTHAAHTQGNGVDVMLSGLHPGREWELFSPDNRKFYVRTYFVRDGNTYHHFLLMAKGPFHIQRQNADVTRFFNSFSFLEATSGELVYEEIDTIQPNAGTRRDNEFSALALHPKAPTVVLGSVISQVSINHLDGANEKNKPFLVQFQAKEGKPIEQLAISRDGRWLALAVGGAVQYGQDWTEAGPRNKISVPGIRCAFTKDHHLLVATQDDITEYDPNTGKSVATLKNPGHAIKGFALSADESTLAVHGDKLITLWQWPEKKQRGQIEAHDAAITSIAFAPDGKTLASGSVDRTIKLWNVETQEGKATLKQHAWTVWALAFTPDGKQLASGGLDGMFLVWNVEAAPPQLVWARAHQFPVRAITFDDEGKHCYLTCKRPNGSDGLGARQFARQLRKIVWADMKPNTEEALKVVAQRAGLHLPTTSTMTYMSPGAHTVVTTTDGIDRFTKLNSLRVWDSATATLKHTQSMNFRGVLSPDGKWFAFAEDAPGAAIRLQVLDVQNGQVGDNVVILPAGPAGEMPMVMFAPDSKAFWVLRNHELVRCAIQVQRGGRARLMQQTTVKLKEPNDQRMIIISPALDQKTFLVETSSIDAVVRTRRLYALADGKELPMPDPGPWSPFQRLRRMAGTSVELHDFLHGDSKTIGQQRGLMTMHAIRPDGKYAVSAESVNNQVLQVNLWDLQARRPVLTLRESATVAGLRFSPDGRFLALVTNDSWTRIVPVDWLMERQALLPCQPNDVAEP